MALNTISGSGTQDATQSPQTSSGTATGVTSSNIQPGITSSLLSSQNGIPLRSTDLLSVNLAGTTQATQSLSVQSPTQHHFNASLLSLPIGLFILAIVLFWLSARAEKSTTHI